MLRLVAGFLLFAAFAAAAHALLQLLARWVDGGGEGAGDGPAAFAERARAKVSALAARTVSSQWPGLVAELEVQLRRAGRGRGSVRALVGDAMVVGVAVGTVVWVAQVALNALWLPILPALVAAGLFVQPLFALYEAADRRITAISRRLPYSADLIVLAMEAGSSFEESLEILCRDAPNEPLHAEFEQVLRDQRLGMTRQQTLQDLADRIGTDDLRRLVGAVELGSRLGTPLAQTLRTQAQEIRQSRVVRAEKLAREAGPKMVLPNTLIMFANILLILGPFIPTLRRGFDQ